MKKILLFSLIINFLNTNQAQEYEITFSGTGASYEVDSVKVKNLSTEVQLTISGSDTLFLFNPNNIRKNTLMGNSMSIAPNPMQGSTKITVRTSKNTIANIRIIDATGKMLTKMKNNLFRGKNVFEVSGLPSGAHTVSVNTPDWSYAKPVISVQSNASNPSIKLYSQSQDNSNTISSRRNTKDNVYMEYSQYQRLLFIAYSHIYATASTLIPLENTNVESEFVECTDIDGNNYVVAHLFGETWMAENLKTTTLNDGSNLPNITENNTWKTTNSPAYCDYGNLPEYSDFFGRLYNWYAVNTGNLCPEGWHVASEADWFKLTDTLGGDAICGGTLKTVGINYWTNPNVGATNSVGFSSLPNGIRNFLGEFSLVAGRTSNYWTADGADEFFAWCREIFYMDVVVFRNSNDKRNGLVVRCVKNQ